MITWTLANIRQKVRQVTGRASHDEMSNSRLDDYINKYYLYTFPAEVKLDTKHTYYQFTTVDNQAIYDAPSGTYTNFEPPVTANNLLMDWYQDPTVFSSLNPLQYTMSNPWTGDAATVTFTTTVGGFPIYPGTMTISDGVELFQDTNEDWTTADVALTGDDGGTATINYSTGAVSVTFAAAPASGTLVHLNYVVFVASRPQALLYYDSKFQLFPVPDMAYVIKMQTYKIVDELEDATDTPDLNEWGPCIAYGAAREIFSDYGENDSYSEASMLLKEQISLILTRTAQNLLNVRAMPQF